MPKKVAHYDDDVKLKAAVQRECRAMLARTRGEPTTDTWLAEVRKLLFDAGARDLKREKAAHDARKALRILNRSWEILRPTPADYGEPEPLEPGEFEQIYDQNFGDVESVLNGHWLPPPPPRKDPHRTSRSSIVALRRRILGWPTTAWLDELAAVRLLVEGVPRLKKGQSLSVRAVIELETRHFRPLVADLRPMTVDELEPERRRLEVARRRENQDIEVVSETPDRRF